MTPEMNKFLTGLQLHLAIEATSYTVSHFYEIGLDFGFADAVTKKTFLVLLGKLQAALLKAQAGSPAKLEELAQDVAESLSSHQIDSGA